MKRSKLYDYDVKWIDDFKEGLAPFLANSDEYGMHLYGFVNKKFEVVIPPIYRKVKHFSQGLAPVKLGKEWKFINIKGKVIIDEPFADIVDIGFSQGLCACRRVDGGLYGYINKKGVFKIKPQFQVAFAFFSGLAVVCIDNGIYCIDKRGEFVSKRVAAYTGL
jgi:hypothetical protein